MGVREKRPICPDLPVQDDPSSDGRCGKERLEGRFTPATDPDKSQGRHPLNSRVARGRKGSSTERAHVHLVFRRLR